MMPRKLLWFALVVILVASPASLFVVSGLSKTDRAVVASAADGTEEPGIAALGHVEPEDGVVKVGGRSLSGQPSLVAELRVKERDYVRAGQVLAVLNSRDQMQAAWRQAEAQTKVAETRLLQVRAGAKAADVAGEEAEISRLEAELSNAKAEFGRFEQLRGEGIVSASAFEAARLTVATRTQMLAQARERLKSFTEVRQVDIDVAESELLAAVAAATRAQAEYEAAVIRSPYNGHVVKIHARRGEEIGVEGLIELGRTDRMFAIAEVSETDIGRVKVGQRATITGASITEKLQGTVDQIGMKIGRNAMFHTDPVSFSDSRIIEVKILLDENNNVAGLIDAQVKAVIHR